MYSKRKRDRDRVTIVRKKLIETCRHLCVSSSLHLRIFGQTLIPPVNYTEIWSMYWTDVFLSHTKHPMILSNIDTQQYEQVSYKLVWGSDHPEKPSYETETSGIGISSSYDHKIKSTHQTTHIAYQTTRCITHYYMTNG